MGNDWNSGIDGHNEKFKRETLLNYGMNRWGLNKASSGGATSELIRECSPATYEEWVDFYFSQAAQKKKGGIQITREYLRTLGEELYLRLSENVSNELSCISEEECIDYVYNLVVNRTYEGYRTEIETIYGQLENSIGRHIEAAPDKWDRQYSVDFYIQVGSLRIGLQIKPVSTITAINQHLWMEQDKSNNAKFTQKYGGKVFFVFSTKVNGAKRIANPEVVEEIKEEIDRLTSASEPEARQKATESLAQRAIDREQ
ncbi:MAG: MjaI family restriction endonuclease [Prevotellaceae bacterium]|nr:MjaI family restriction endonuclease [Prevotellaceae bacterium]